jgi:hypothetical protein
VKAGAVADAAAAAKKAKDISDARWKAAGNNVDGLVHGSNGAEHPEGGLVGGAN